MQFFFSSSAMPMFGVYHAAAGDNRRMPAVLLCPPHGVEAVRAYRILRVMAEKLAQAGAPVLRFDYRGTGDAAGECGDYSMSSAIEDIRQAHQELIDLSGATRLVWVGFRLSTLLLMQAAREKQRGLIGVGLWDPVTDGNTYLAELRAAHVRDLAWLLDEAVEEVEKRCRPDRDLREALGFEIGRQLHDELVAASAIHDFDGRLVRNIAVVGGDENGLEPGLRQRCEQYKIKTAHVHDDTPQDWNSDAALNSFQVPMQTILKLVSAIGDMR